jgi:hypothetical protein
MREFKLQKITTPVLRFLLKGETRFPALFLFGCRIRLGRFKARIENAFPEDFVNLTALPLCVYINLKEKFGERKAYEIMRIAILTAGVAKQNILFDPVEKGRSFETFIEQEMRIHETGTTKWNKSEIIEQSEKRFEIKVTNCLYHELAVSMGIPEVTSLICQVDNAVFNSYMPEKIIFHREGAGNRIADGRKECRFIWERVE